MKSIKRTIAITCATILLFCFFGCQENTFVASETSLPNTNELLETNSFDYNVLYQNIIDDYIKLVEFRLSPDFEETYNSDQNVEILQVWSNYIWAENASDSHLEEIHYHWHCMLADMLDYLPTPSTASFGYIQTDLNGDQVPELIWVSENYEVFCIFTVCRGQVRLVDAFFPKYKCVILDTGNLYTMKIGGAENFVYTVSKISNSTSSLITQKEFGKENSEYYEKKDGVNCFIDEKEFEKLCSDYPFSTTDIWKNNAIHFLDFILMFAEEANFE